MSLLKNFTRGFWLAYREQRWFLLLAIVVLELLLWTPFQAGFLNKLYRGDPLCAQIVVFFPAIIMLIGISMTVPSLRESGTLERLRLSKLNPLSFMSGQYLWILLVGIVSLALTYVVINQIATGPSESLPELVFKYVGVVWLQVFAWGILTSSFCKRMLRSLLLSAVLLNVSTGLTFLLFFFAFSNDKSATLTSRYLESEEFNSFLVKTLIIVLALGLYWTYYGFRLNPKSIVNYTAVLSDRSRGNRSRNLSIQPAVRFGRTLNVIFHQELRTKWWWSLSLIGFVILLVMSTFQDPWFQIPRYPEDVSSLYVFGVVPGVFLLLSTAIGAFAHRNDLADQSYRFFENMGISIRDVWLNRLVVSLFAWGIFVGLFLIWSMVVDYPPIEEVTSMASRFRGYDVVMMINRGEGHTLHEFRAILLASSFCCFIGGQIVASLGRSVILLLGATSFTSALGLGFFLFWNSYLELGALLVWFVLIAVACMIGGYLFGWKLHTSQQKTSAAIRYTFLAMLAPTLAFGIQYWKYAHDVPPRPADGSQPVFQLATFQYASLAAKFRFTPSRDLQAPQVAGPSQVTSSATSTNEVEERAELDAAVNVALEYLELGESLYEAQVMTDADRAYFAEFVDSGTYPVARESRRTIDEAKLIEFKDRILATYRRSDLVFGDQYDEWFAGQVSSKVPSGFNPKDFYFAVDEANRRGLLPDGKERIEIGFAVWNFWRLQRKMVNTYGVPPRVCNLPRDLIWEGCLAESDNIELLEQTLEKLLRFETDPFSFEIQSNSFERWRYRYQDGYQRTAFESLVTQPYNERQLNELWYSDYLKNKIGTVALYKMVLGGEFTSLTGRGGMSSYARNILSQDEQEIAARINLHGLGSISDTVRSIGVLVLHDQIDQARVGCLIHRAKTGEYPERMHDLVDESIVAKIPRDPFTGGYLVIAKLSDFNASQTRTVSGEANKQSTAAMPVIWSPTYLAKSATGRGPGDRNYQIGELILTEKELLPLTAYWSLNSNVRHTPDYSMADR